MENRAKKPVYDTCGATEYIISAENSKILSNQKDDARSRIIKLVYYLSEHYFRTKVIHKEPNLRKINEQTNLVFAANHSGMSFPWDSFILYLTLLDDLGEKRELKALQTPALNSSRLMSPFGVDKFWDYFCAPATIKNFQQSAWKKENIFIHPEGVAGIAKGFNKKYQMQKFSSSMVRICLQYNLPLVPVYIVNGEYLNPFAYKITILNQWVNKLGIPFLPISPMIFPLLLVPFVFYMSLPANLHYVIDKAIYLNNFTDKKYEELSVSEIHHITKMVQEEMQKNLDENVLIYGKNPYAIKSFLAEFKKLGTSSYKLFPGTWTFLFHKAARYKSGTAAITKEVILCTSLSLPIIGWPLYILSLAIFKMPNRY
ncbi:MAG: hypothetical protein KBD76_01570 [Bacteriovorax sp.]|nr:hypothetical protein [Bacteriovorax sp.]